jgi:FKBP-type peptidyl-prolyl cis-trans isomerase SlyD
MQISPKKVVILSYALSLNSGEIVDQATTEKPLAFIHGVGQTLPAFDEALAGKSPQDSFKFSLTKDQAYGNPDSEMVMDLPRQIFAEAPEGALAVGNMLPMQDQQGNVLQGTIVAMNDQAVKMDFNHPLAGEDLHFSGTVLEVRDATAEELDHGHVHGPGGHQH